ncbi:MAG: acyl carrier protein [Acetatifactor sp.]|nr:acyl carrier protein [Acetatifactor sp.]
MTRKEVFEKLNDIFRDVFDDDTIEVNEDTTAADIDEWDSLMHITLIGTVEDEFDIKFAMKDIVGMKNVGAMADRILELI